MKTQQTMASILKGVSQQPPAERLEGQHAEQVNLISDPVHGLVRRNGMPLIAQQHDTITTLEPGDAIADSYSFRVFSFSIYTNEFDMVYRSRPIVGTRTDAHLDGLQVFNKQGVRGFMDVVVDPLDPGIDEYIDGGFSSVVVIGRMVLVAGNTVSPVVAVSNKYTDAGNLQKGTLYVKTGKYATKYEVKVKRQSDGLVVTASYTTPSAACATCNLVVNDLDPDDPHYVKFLNDRIYGYEQAVNAWALSAANAILPSNIAQELLNQLVAGGLTDWSRTGNYLHSVDVEYMTVTDDQSEKMLVAVLSEVESEQDLSPRHYNGKIVKVRPSKSSDNAFYMQAVTADGATFGEVDWRETAGVQQEVQKMLAFGTVEAGKFFFASQPSILKSLVFATTGINIAVPEYVKSGAGDLDTMPLPTFAGRPIDLLTVFQDRLIVGVGNVLRLSRVGDYLNFFQESALTIAATDAAEVFAVGTQGDTIRHAALYDRNMTFYGDNFHYVMPGRQAFDPQNPQFSVQYAVKGTGRSQPVSAGDKVFVLKEDTSLAACQVLQLNPGVWQDSPQMDTVSKQLRTYINGTPAEMVSLTAPSFLFVRTEFINRSEGAYPMARPFGLYTYSYMDQDGQRPFESWSSWEWAAALGTPIGISAGLQGDGILLYTLAFNTTAAGYGRSVLVMEASARSAPTGMPYIDGAFPAGAETGVLTPAADYRVTQAVRTVRDASWSAVPPTVNDFNRWDIRPQADYSVGDQPPQEVDSLRWIGSKGWGTDWQAENPEAPLSGAFTGFHYTAFVDLTSPYMRDHTGKVRLYGRLTLTSYRISAVRTGGIAGYVAHHSGVDNPLYATPGFELEHRDYSIWVGRDSSKVQTRISSVDWHPLNITAISWQGDWNNSQGR